MIRGTKHGLGGWYDTAQAPPPSHEPGTLLAKPVIALGCWGCTQPGRPGVHERPRSCSMRARARHLTCNAHRKLEGAAQALKKRLDAAKAVMA